MMEIQIRLVMVEHYVAFNFIVVVVEDDVVIFTKHNDVEGVTVNFYFLSFLKLSEVQYLKYLLPQL